jgi:diguanylate cyclase (GGDEF)-like protein
VPVLDDNGNTVLLLHPVRTNTVARFGGDEFVVLLEGLECPADAECVAERVLQTARGCPLPPGMSTQPSVNVGVAIARNAALTAKLLISQADAAMYRAKHPGGGRFELFDAVAHS